MKRILIGSILLAGLAACAGKKETDFPIPTDVVKRTDIKVTADATGKIEPIQIIDIKSKAGGQIVTMPVESGTKVKTGDLIVDLDKKDVNASYQQADADLQSAQAQLANSQRIKARNDTLFAAKVITSVEKESSDLSVVTQTSNVIRSKQALDLAQQRVDDATIKAPTDGVVLDKLVSIGTVIASASSSASGGTTLVHMADLTHVRARVLVTETDIGKVSPGLTTTVLVDAYPNRPFEGIVEKMEPQAVVDQNVTMFPVLVNLDNADGALMPGMNGEVSIFVDQKRGALSIPLDAFRLANEAGTVAEMFGSTKAAVDSVTKLGGRGGPRATQVADDSSQQVPVGRGPAAGDSAQAGRGQMRPNGGGANGAGAGRSGATGGNGGNGGGRGQGGRGGRGGGQSAEQCKATLDAFDANTALQTEIADLNKKMGSAGNPGEILAQRTEAYKKAGLDERTVNGCLRSGGGGGGGGSGRGGRGGGRGGRGGGRGGAGGAGAVDGALGTRNNGLGVRGQGVASSGIVFVRVGLDTTVKPAKAKFEPRYVRLGVQNYDVAEVVSGLQEGDVVGLVAGAKIELQRRQAAEKQKANTSLIPGQGGASPRGAGGPGGGGPPGGGGGGRGGRGG